MICFRINRLPDKYVKDIKKMKIAQSKECFIMIFLNIKRIFKRSFSVYKVHQKVEVFESLSLKCQLGNVAIRGGVN